MTAPDSRRLAWFTDAELRAELNRRATTNRRADQPACTTDTDTEENHPS